jgi:Glycosyl hydrolases family 43
MVDPKGIVRSPLGIEMLKRSIGSGVLAQAVSLCMLGARLALLAALLLMPAAASAAVIRNHSTWIDTAGKPIDCHEGSLLRVGNTFYWHCRMYHGNVDGIYGAGGAQFRGGLNCYSSTDLEHWTYHGVCLPYPDSGFLTLGTWHRPRVIYNAQTGKYVLWFFMFPTGTPAPFAMVVATAGSPTGPFTVLTGPDKGVSGDLATFLDKDGKGYLAYDDNRNVRVTRLSADFLNLTAETTIALSNAGGGHEGSSMVLYKGKYIVAGSAVVGLDPSDTTYALADSPLGPYVEKGLMSEQKTWNSQISAFVYLPETDLLFAMNEQWLLGPDGKRAPAEQSTQLWLPVTFDPTTGVARMQFVEQWDPWGGKAAPGDSLDAGVADTGGQGETGAGGGHDSEPQTGLGRDGNVAPVAEGGASDAASATEDEASNAGSAAGAQDGCACQFLRNAPKVERAPWGFLVALVALGFRHRRSRAVMSA